MWGWIDPPPRGYCNTPVTTPEPYRAADAVGAPGVKPRFRVAAYDYGIKFNILRLLGEHACDVTVFPASTPAGEIRDVKIVEMFEVVG